MNVQVLYVSGTGNTEKIAKEIYRAVPDSSKDIKRLESCYESSDADIYFIGFWTNRGSASMEVLDYLSELHGKKIALFATCGLGNDDQYFQQIEHNVTVFIPDDNQYLGSYFCCGKMPIKVREKYEQLLTTENKETVNAMLRGFDEALLHPNQTDLANAAQFTHAVFEQLKYLNQQEEV